MRLDVHGGCYEGNIGAQTETFRWRMAGALVSLMTVVGMMLAVSATASGDTCPNADRRQGPSINLPDCRAYELVTPVDKGDSPDLFSTVRGNTADRGYPSASGDSFLMGTGAASFAGGVSGSNVYLFSRTSTGWVTAITDPPGLGVQSLAAAVFDPTNLSVVGFTDETGSQANFEANGSALQLANLVGTPGDSYVTIASEPLSEHSLRIAGASQNVSRVVLEGWNHELVAGGIAQEPESNALYSWSQSDGLRLVNVNDASELLSPCGAILGQARSVGGTHNAVSDDGAKIFFTVPDPEGRGSGCWEKESIPQVNPPQIYMRLNGTNTVEISRPDPGVNDPSGMQPAVYVGASADGSRVFFMTQTELTPDDSWHATELYEYNTVTNALTRISRGSTGSGPAKGDVDYVPAIAEDGSTVYFTAFGQLAPGLPALKEGQVYLYRYETSSGETRFVTTVGSNEFTSNTTDVWYSFSSEVEEPRPAKVALNVDANWYTTADGRYLVFASQEPITGYNSEKAEGVNCEGLQTGAAGNGSCAEIFRYDADDGSILCVSCGPPGVAQLENTLFARSAYNGGTSSKNPAGSVPRPISEDGSYVFFDTANALVPQASSGAIHVYEWHDGVISLISAASDPANSFYLGASNNASSVFFGSHAQLAAQDSDFSGDLYDARVDGGFETVTRPDCTNDSCQSSPELPSVFATPASMTFEGAGNTRPATPKTTGTRVSRAALLRRALLVCRHVRRGAKRRRCEAAARRHYRAHHPSKFAHRGHKSNGRSK